MAERTREVSVYLPDAVYGQLRGAARERGQTITGFCRLAVIVALGAGELDGAPVRAARYSMALEAIVLSRAVDVAPLQTLARVALSGEPVGGRLG